MENMDDSNARPSSKDLVEGKYSIRDLIDLDRLRKMLEKISAATKTAIGLTSYPDQENLILASWNEICTKFHRQNPESAKCCVESNVSLTSKLGHGGAIGIEACGNGLVDGGVPIIIKGKHLATLVAGQVFFEKPDIERFRKQAERYGYDAEKYLEAVRAVPVVSKEDFEATLSFLGDIAELVTGLGYDKLEALDKSARLEEQVSRYAKADEALESQRSVLSTIMNSLPVFIYYKDAESRFLAVNNATAHAMGADSPEELIGKTDADYYPPDMAAKFLADEREIVRTGRPMHDIEEEIRTADGRTLWLLTSKVPIRDRAGKVTGIVGVGRDITERRQTEEALIASEESYRSIFNTANDAIFVHDIETGQIVDVNDKACEMYIYPKEELLRLSVQDISMGESPYTREDLLNYINKAAQGEPQLFEWVAKDKAQRFFWVEVNLKKAVIGGKYRMLAIVRDVTERKDFEDRWAKIHQAFLSFGPDPEENIKRLTTLCGELLQGDCALYSRIEEGELRACGQWNAPPDFIETDRAEGHICYDVAKNARESVVVIRNLQETDYIRTDPNVSKYNLHTYVGRAVKFANSYVGTLCVVFQRDVNPGEEDKEIMGFIALAIGVEEERKQAEEVSEIARFSIERSADPVFWIGPEGNILYVNEMTCMSLGYARDELMGMTVSDIDPNFTREVWPAHWKEVKERRSFTLETTHRRKDGTVFPVEVTVNYLEVQGREYNFAFARDISQRKRQEEELLRRDYQLEILSRTSQHVNAVLEGPVILRTLTAAAIELVDATSGAAGLMVDGRLVFDEYNREGKVEPLGHSPDSGWGLCACIFKPSKTYICNDVEKDPGISIQMRERFGVYNLANVPILNREGRMLGCLEIHNKKDGRPFDAQDIFMLQGLAAGASVALENANILKQRDKAEKELEWQRNYYETLLEEANVCIQTLDEDGNTVFWNKKSEELTGYSKQEVVGSLNAWTLLYPVPDERSKTLRLIREMIAEGKTIKDMETEVTISSGSKKIMSWSSNVVRDSSGKIIGSMLIGADITDRRLVEKEREALTKEIMWSNKRLKQLALKDAQTGLYNHNYLSEVIESEFYRARRYGHPLSIVLIDIDYFKSVNDLYGHEFGDLVLKQFAVLLRKLVRKYDTVVRFGGEEFVILSSGSDRTKARSMAERLLEAISLYNFGDDKRVIKLKLSMAVAAQPEDNISKGMDLVDVADKILVKVKEAGGNNVLTSSDVKRRGKISLENADITFLKKKIANLTRRDKQSLIESIFAFAKTIEMRDHYTGKHAENTVQYSTELAKVLKISREDTEHIKQAAVLHDLGKIGISDRILHKRSKLTEKEYDEIKRHPQIAADIIRPIQFMHDIIPLVLYHHERWDGKGYPAGLKGDQIPIGARIISIADAYQALTSDRPYRKAYSKAKAMRLIRDGSGKQFDPAIVDAFLDILKREKRVRRHR